MLAADTVSAARESPMHLSELRAGVSKYRKKRIVRKWLLQLETHLPDAYNWFMDVPKPDSKQLLLSSSFENIEAAYDWIAGADSIHRWISGSKSVESWTAEYEEARMHMIEAARSCKAPVMQRVLDLACLVPQRIADDGHWVYVLDVLASPLWGKCYVGGGGADIKDPAVRCYGGRNTSGKLFFGAQKPLGNGLRHQLLRITQQWHRFLFATW